MRDKDDNIIWNILLLEKHKKEYRIIMPDETTGELPGIKESDKGYHISWPINPWFTGKSGIAVILGCYPQFNGCNFIT